MALSAATEWDVRTTANDLNGGGFNVSATGTDYSQQDSPQITFTDLVIGATTTQLTSALTPFLSAHVGNIVNVTSGTGFTTGRYQVVSVSPTYTWLNRAGWTLVSTSDQTWGAASNAIDGNTGTIWATVNAVPQHIIIDMGSAQTFEAIGYMDRQDAFNDSAGNVEVYVSSNGSTWGTAVATGTFVQTKALQTLSFASQTFRYIKFVVTSAAVGARGFIGCAEFYAGSGSVLAATMDRAVGTAASTGGNGRLGGALAGYSTGLTAMTVSGMVMHLKAGTYTLTTATNTPAAGIWFGVIGFGSAHYDNGTRPLVTCATNSVHLHNVTNGTTAPHNWTNINFSHTASTRGCWGNSGSGQPIICFTDCNFTGFANLYTGWLIIAGSTYMTYCSLTSFVSASGTGAFNGPNFTLNHCRIIDNSLCGIRHTQSGSIPFGSVYRCVIANNGSHGISCANTPFNIRVMESTIANNTGSGLLFQAGADPQSANVIVNNIFYGNGAYGLALSSTYNKSRATAALIRNNAYGSNTTANKVHWSLITASYSTLPAQTGDVTLTADPFTSSGTRDYSLNNTSGGGAACRAAGTQPT